MPSGLSARTARAMVDKRAHDVRIGTSGWNYPAPGYGPWTGVFYPLKQGQKIPGTKAKFDELAYYAERFDTVEINNTFYRPPAVKIAAVVGEAHPARLRVQPEAVPADLRTSGR